MLSRPSGPSVKVHIVSGLEEASGFSAFMSESDSEVLGALAAFEEALGPCEAAFEDCMCDLCEKPIEDPDNKSFQGKMGFGCIHKQCFNVLC